MRISSAIAIGLSIAWTSLAAQTKTTTDAVVAGAYQCGDYSALLMNHADSASGAPEDVLLIVRHSNIFHQAENYTLVRVASNAAEIPNADLMWQCSAASAADGCRMAARMAANGTNGAASISLQLPDKIAIECVLTRRSAGEQTRRVDVNAASLNKVRNALTNASGSLQRAANQSDYVQNAMAVIDQALDDANQAAAHIYDDSGVRPPSPIPNFHAPPPPQRGANLMLYSSLDSLKTAYDALNRIPGGDFAGYRVRLNHDIATAAGALVNGISLYNARHP